MTMPYVTTTGSTPMRNGATYGVGIVPVVHFDEQIPDKGAAEKALVVTTSAARSTGSWYWTDDQTAHWRPRTYLPAGHHGDASPPTSTACRSGRACTAQADAAVSFKIGAKHVSIADDRTHTVSVYFNDKLQRVMPTSMGRGGSVDVNGQTISFWTQTGTYTVIGQGNPVIMDSSTYGLPVNSKLGYKEPIYWATQISTDGMYLHELDATVWAQGNTDVSHGCLNLNHDNAYWYYKTAQIGDPVDRQELRRPARCRSGRTATGPSRGRPGSRAARCTSCPADVPRQALAARVALRKLICVAIKLRKTGALWIVNRNSSCAPSRSARSASSGCGSPTCSAR